MSTKTNKNNQTGVNLIRQQIHQVFDPYHRHLSSRSVFYKKWHNYKYHRHFHYFAVFCGLVLALYFIMIDEILSRITL
ncbi:MAG: hypothetical protein ACOZAR_02845 [Patescibacteria group bacterium]